MPVTPVLVHVALATGRLAPAATVLAAAQIAVATFMVLRRRRAAAAWVAAGGVALILLAARLAWPESLAVEAGLAHAALQGTLLAMFARTLRAGRTPLVTALAQRIHGARTPELAAYTRRVTQAWCGFFAAQLAASAALLAAAPLWAWSLFVNVLDAPLCVLMFAAEYGYRHWRFRNQAHARPADIIRAFAGPDAGPGER